MKALAERSSLAEAVVYMTAGGIGLAVVVARPFQLGDVDHSRDTVRHSEDTVRRSEDIVGCMVGIVDRPEDIADRSQAAAGSMDRAAAVAGSAVVGSEVLRLQSRYMVAAHLIWGTVVQGSRSWAVSGRLSKMLAASPG